MAERWTRQQRLDHTRRLLLDAAEAVVAKRGFGGAALEDVAEVSGYTRGAIYSHFGTKEELFLAVVERHLRWLRGNFDTLAAVAESVDVDIDCLTRRWRELGMADPDKAALGHEAWLFLLRNPNARDRLAPAREQTVRALADCVTSLARQSGSDVGIPVEVLARLLMAASEGIVIGGHLDHLDLCRPYLQLVVSGADRRGGSR